MEIDTLLPQTWRSNILSNELSMLSCQRHSTIVETDHSDHFEWGNLRRQRWRISRPFHQQPITCVVTAEPGKL